MSDVFISYSRRDIDFVGHLLDQLTAHDREPWADWQDIPSTADWLAEIYSGIEAANTFLFVISPDSVASEICTLEIEHAVKHNKRLVPVVWKDADDVHQAMSAHNWVFLRAEDDFEANFELLIDALDTDLDYVREHTRLLTLAIDWDQKQRRRSAGLRGQELQIAEGWLAQSGSKDPQPAALHSEYIAFSRAAVSRIQRLIYSGIAIAFVLVLGLAVFAFYQRNQAQETARISTARSLAAFALAEMDKDPERSLLLATKSVRIMSEANEIVLPLSNGVLHQSIIKSRVRLTLTGHDGEVLSAVYSPDGRRIVTASKDQTAKVWDAEMGTELFMLTGHDDQVWSAVYSPDGERIVTASGDRTAKMWDANTGQELMTLTGHEGGVMSAAYSANGQRIVTASNDKTAKVWDANTAKELLTLTGHGGQVFSAAYSPDGQRIVTGSYDQTAKVWDAQTGTELLTLTGHDNVVWSAVFSPDGQRIVTASTDKTAKVWEAQTGTELMTLTGHESGGRSAAYSPDGQRIVTAGSWDYTAKVWEAQTGTEPLTLKGHDGSVLSAVYSEMGRGFDGERR